MSGSNPKRKMTFYSSIFKISFTKLYLGVVYVGVFKKYKKTDSFFPKVLPAKSPGVKYLL